MRTEMLLETHLFILQIFIKHPLYAMHYAKC